MSSLLPKTHHHIIRIYRHHHRVIVEETWLSLALHVTTLCVSYCCRLRCLHTKSWPVFIFSSIWRVDKCWLEYCGSTNRADAVVEIKSNSWGIDWWMFLHTEIKQYWWFCHTFCTDVTSSCSLRISHTCTNTIILNRKHHQHKRKHLY